MHQICIFERALDITLAILLADLARTDCFDMIVS